MQWYYFRYENWNVNLFNIDIYSDISIKGGFEIFWSDLAKFIKIHQDKDYVKYLKVNKGVAYLCGENYTEFPATKVYRLNSEDGVAFFLVNLITIIKKERDCGIIKELLYMLEILM